MSTSRDNNGAAMNNLSYRIIHLKNGTTLYTEDEYTLPRVDERSVTQITGLDDIEYEFLDNEVVLTNISTPESRQRLNELKYMLQQEAAAFTHGKMVEMQEQMAAQQKVMEMAAREGRLTDRVVDGLMRDSALKLEQ